MAILNLRNKIKYLKDDGRPSTVIRTGSSTSKGMSSSSRSTSMLRTYWNYYSGDGTIFAALNITAWNTVMVGYTLESDNADAKEFISKICNKIQLERSLRQSTLYTLIFGDSYIEKIYNKKKDIVRLKVVDPRTMVINTDEYGDVVDYYQEIGGKTLPSIKPEKITHIRFFEIPGDAYGISLIQPNKDTIDRKVKTDEALYNAIQRHGTLKWICQVGSEKDGQIPPDSIMDAIKTELEDIESKNEFVVPWFINLKPIDEGGIEGIEEYFNYFQTQLVIGLLCPEEALGLGKGSTEACYDEKTEVLTIDGWKKHLDLTNDDIIATYNPDTKQIEYNKPIDPVEKHIYEHDGPMIKFKSQKMDMMVTPNHRMWVNKNPTSTKENWEFVSAEEIYNSNSHWAIKSRVEPESYKMEFPPKQPVIDLMKFIGYYVSEGSINSNEPYCRLSQKKEDSAHRMREVIYSNYPEFKESYSEDKGYEWHWYNKELYNFLKEFGDNCYNRHIPRKFLDYQPEYLKYLLFAAIDGDGTYDTREGRNTCEYTTTSKQLADDIQEIALMCGYRTNLIFSEDKRENRVGMWRVRIDLSEKDYTIITPSMCEKVYYKGKVNCLNVPNHIYLTRRNNKVAIQGNTARIKAIMYERMIKAFQEELENIVVEEIFNPMLEKYGFEPYEVLIRFNEVTEEDQALRAKWLGNFLRGLPEIPFTKNELRAMFGLNPRSDMENVPTEQPSENPEEPEEVEEPEEEPEEEDEENDEDLS